MKIDELKLRLCQFLNGMVDAYYGAPTVGEKLLNYTLKIIVKNNIYKVEPLLCLFKDESGEIDAETIIHEYMNQMGNEKMTFDLRNMIDSDTIKSMLPDKALVISADDISKIINGF